MEWRGAKFAVDFSAATTQVQLQNLSDTPLAFVWGRALWHVTTN
jgi:hypothetical protein